MLDSVMLHQLVEERSLTRLSHGWVSETNKGVEVASKDSFLLVDFSKVEFRHLNGLARSVRVA